MTLHLALGTSLGKERISQVEIKVIQMATYRAEPRTWVSNCSLPPGWKQGTVVAVGKVPSFFVQSSLNPAKISHLDKRQRKDENWVKLQFHSLSTRLFSSFILLTINKMNGNYWVQRWIYLGIAEKLQFRTSKLWRAIGEFKETKGRLAFIRSGKKWRRVVSWEKERSGLWWFLTGSNMYLCEISAFIASQLHFKSDFLHPFSGFEPNIYGLRYGNDSLCTWIWPVCSLLSNSEQC